MANFKSIVIPEKIIIVENSSGQGYVVLPDKPDMLASAKSWADGWVYGEGANWTERHENGHKWEPVVHEFENGKFSLTLCDSADNSYNGGKLSFWNCMIKAPNGKEFKIGINQELLCNLLKDCTLIKGVCQENIWLGKQLSNTGVYIDTMQDFLQAKEELEIRKQSKSKTVKYQVGDIVDGTVVSMKPFGAFVELEDGLEALVHISNITMRRIQKPQDALEMGQEVTAKVVEVDLDKKRIELSIRELEGAAVEAEATTEAIEGEQITLDSVTE